MQVEKKSNWQKDLEKSLVELGWGGVKGAELEGLSMTEIAMMYIYILYCIVLIGCPFSTRLI